MNTVFDVNEALSLYRLEDAKVTLLRHNENRTYRIDCKERSFCLRLNTPVSGFDLAAFGGDREALLRGELGLMSALGAQTDIPVQTPVNTIAGDVVARLSDGTLASLLTWMEGVPFDNEKCNERMLVTAGQTLAKLRNAAEANPDLSAFTRFSYDQKLLERLAVRVEQGTEYFPADAIRSIIRAMDTVCCIMDEMDAKEAPLIAHADPGFGNMIWMNDGAGMDDGAGLNDRVGLNDGAGMNTGVGLIDWSLTGYAHSYMDLGGLMGATSDREEQRLLLKGWESIRRKADRRYLDAYFTLGVLLFVSCQHTRAKDWTDWFPAALERWQQTIFDLLSSGRLISCIL